MNGHTDEDGTASEFGASGSLAPAARRVFGASRKVLDGALDAVSLRPGGARGSGWSRIARRARGTVGAGRTLAR